MSYVDNVRSASRPSCWGNTLSYDPNDAECVDCRFHHSCDVECNRRGGTRVHVSSSPNYSNDRYGNTGYNSRTNYRPKHVPHTDTDAGTNPSAMIEPNEKPIDRFTKDAIGGGLRGMFYEMWQFWRHYRIR